MDVTSDRSADVFRKAVCDGNSATNTIVSNSNNNDEGIKEGLQPRKGSQPRKQCAMKWRSEGASFTAVGNVCLSSKILLTLKCNDPRRVHTLRKDAALFNLRIYHVLLIYTWLVWS